MVNNISNISRNYNRTNFYDFERRHERYVYKNFIKKYDDEESLNEHSAGEGSRYEDIFVAVARSICGSYTKDYFFTRYNDIVACNYGLFIDIRV